MTESTYPSIQEEQTFDFRKLVTRVLRNWYWIVLSVVICLGIATWINRYTNAMFSASATLIINDERKSTAELLINALDRYNARKNVENEIAVLKSYRLAYKAISELNYKIFYYEKGDIRQTILYNKSPFQVILDTSRINTQETPVYITLLSDKEYEVNIEGNYPIRKKIKYGEFFRSSTSNFTVKLANPEFLISSQKKYFFIINNINKLASQYSKKINIVTNDKKGTVLTLQVTGSDPQMETDYVNKLMEVYIRSGLEEKNQTAINTINFIDHQLAVVVDSLNLAEAKIQDFKTKSKMMAVSEEGQYLFSKIDDAQKKKASMEIELRYYQYLEDYFNSKKDFSSVIAPSFIGIEESPIANSINQLIELYKERKTLLLTATKDNPAITLTDEKIQSLLDALQENTSEAIKVTNDNIKELDYQLLAIEAEMSQLPSTERKLLNIQRLYNLNDQIYNFLLQKRADAAIARASNVSDNKILDIARAENALQISPRILKNRVLGIILGLMIPIGILFLVELLNPIIADTNDIKKHTKAALLGSIGHNDRDSEIPVVANPQSVIAEAFRALRTNLQYYLREKKQKIICVTSTVSGEGKTFTAVNLAAIIAQAGKKTLLVSLDLRKPKIHQLFNFENKLGLSNFLIEKANYKDIIVSTNIKNLYITLAGPIPPNPAELLETPRMEQFLNSAKEEFDIIVLDTPPLAIVTDAMLLVRHAHATLFVVRANYSSMDVLRLVEELNEKTDIVNLGVVVNDIKFSSYLYGNKYGYKYGYSYGHGYGKGQGYYEEDKTRKKYWWQKIFE